ncbi:hypothetical protein LB505_009390 [Fusarium chuoi]|nr:hypothetical protein LB505_009390 [Fusarium chuoi]
MTDVGKEHYVRAKESDQVLVPQPSQDPHDPLNWSPFWKFSAIFCVSTMTFTQGFAPLALAPMFPDLIRAYDSTLEDVIQFTGEPDPQRFSNPPSSPISSSSTIAEHGTHYTGLCIWAH